MHIWCIEFIKKSFKKYTKKAQSLFFLTEKFLKSCCMQYFQYMSEDFNKKQATLLEKIY